MDVKYQVFISSTFSDLERERWAAMEAVLNLGHIPVGMELFQAANESQWSYIQRRILQCDYFIVVLAERYGSVGPDGKSYTQMEYEFARAQGIPAIAFLLDPEARKGWPSEKVEFERRGEIEAFRALCSSHLMKHWKNGDQLGGRITSSLVELFRDAPRIGWVKADTVAPSTALGEIALLSEEKRELQRRLSELERTAQSPISLRAQHVLTELQVRRVSNFVVLKDGTGLGDDMLLLEMFFWLSKELAIPVTQFGVSRVVANYFKVKDYVDVTGMLQEFSSLGLVSIEMKQVHGFNRVENERYFSISDIGREVVLQYRLDLRDIVSAELAMI